MRDTLRWPTVAVVTAWVLTAPSGAQDAPATQALTGVDTASPARFRLSIARRIEAVEQTPDGLDDAELSRHLMGAGRGYPTSLVLQTFLAEQTYRLGLRHPSGYNSAAAAAQALARLKPDQRQEYLDKVVEIRRRIYAGAQGRAKRGATYRLVYAINDVAEAKARAGQFPQARFQYLRALSLVKGKWVWLARTIEAKLAGLDERHRAMLRQSVRVRQLEERLRKDPKDADARRQLALIHLLERDEPEEAAKLNGPDLDPDLQLCLTMATKRLDVLPAEVCLRIGEWHARQLAGLSDPVHKVRLLLRAKEYLQAFLDKHPEKDLARMQCEISMRQADDALAELTKTFDMLTASLPNVWMDLARQAMPADRRGVGTMGLVPTAEAPPPAGHAGHLLIPWTTLGSYGRRGAPVSVPERGAGGLRCHELLVHRAPKGSMTRVDSDLRTGEEQTVSIHVCPDQELAAVTVRVEGQEQLKWEGAVEMLDPAEGERGISLVTRGESVQFKRVRIRLLSGAMEKVFVAEPPAPKPAPKPKADPKHRPPKPPRK